MKRLFCLTLLVCVVCNLVCCGSYKMSVDQGSFDVSLPLASRGAEYNMDEKSHVKRLTLSLREHSEKSTGLSKVYNGAAVVCEGDEHCTDGKNSYGENFYGNYSLYPSKAKIAYNFKSFPVAFNIDFL